MKNRKSVKDYICSPLGGVVIIIIIVLIIVLLVELAVSRRFGTDDNAIGDVEGGYSYQYDPASQTKIGIMPPTNGSEGSDEPMFVGLEVLIKSGMTAEQYSVFKDVIRKYASDNGISLKRVSYLKDSYSLGGLYVFDFTVVFNVNEMALRVRVDSSEGWKKIVGMKVYLWDKDGNEVYSFEVTEESKCDYLNEC